MVTSSDYDERVYAGVLGKLIGVYLGRPFEGWTHQQITRELGEIDGYVHEKFDVPLVVTDDDISGTFTFLRALEDSGYDPGLSPAQIGDAWLNYLVEEKTILWWGGIGNSTEHTAYIRLKNGISAPRSGSIALNGKTIAEQIGSQIFIDGWAMLFPGDPERAVDFARRAASVSHDAEAIYGAQVVAALESHAFVESDIGNLLDTAVRLIPVDSTIARLIYDVREWHAAETDWYMTRNRIESNYGYDSYRGNCHMVPNHALVIHALLHGGDDFQRSLMIVNTSGWDTDCNSGNVGAILGIKNGLSAVDESPVDWRGPVADRLYLSSAEGGRGITDAVTETIRIVNSGRALQEMEPVIPKDGARFHFSLSGSVQGFQSDDGSAITVNNKAGQLALTLNEGGSAAATTFTFIPPETFTLRTYNLFASPTLYPSQTVTAKVLGATGNRDFANVTMVVRYYGKDDSIQEVTGPSVDLAPGAAESMEWQIPTVGGGPVLQIGFRLNGQTGASVLIDRLDWGGAPSMTIGRPDFANTMWRRAWINGVDQWEERWSDDYRIVQNRGTGLISQGTEGWTDYTATATVRVPLAASAGIAARVGGLRRYYALILGQDGYARLVKARDSRTVLAKVAVKWNPDRDYALELTVDGNAIRGRVDEQVYLNATDSATPLLSGSVGLIVEEGTLASGPVTVASP